MDRVRLKQDRMLESSGTLIKTTDVLDLYGYIGDEATLSVFGTPISFTAKKHEIASLDKPE